MRARRPSARASRNLGPQGLSLVKFSNGTFHHEAQRPKGLRTFEDRSCADLRKNAQPFDPHMQAPRPRSRVGRKKWRSADANDLPNLRGKVPHGTRQRPTNLCCLQIGPTCGLRTQMLTRPTEETSVDDVGRLSMFLVCTPTSLWMK